MCVGVIITNPGRMLSEKRTPQNAGGHDIPALLQWWDPETQRYQLYHAKGNDRFIAGHMPWRRPAILHTKKANHAARAVSPYIKRYKARRENDDMFNLKGNRGCPQPARDARTSRRQEGMALGQYLPPA